MSVVERVRGRATKLIKLEPLAQEQGLRDLGFFSPEETRHGRILAMCVSTC